MPLRDGFSYDIVNANIADMIDAGMSNAVAVASSMSHARKCYFAKHPSGALPEWLAFPKNARLAYRYDTTGKPLSAGQMRVNPAKPDRTKLARAAKLYAKFTGDAFGKVVKIPVASMPKEGLVFGELLVIGYTSMRDGKPYAHEFRKTSRPLLIASHDGKQVVIVGGRYAFTDRGIEDR